MDRNFARVTEVAAVVRASLGRDPVAVERLAGGSKKGVYRPTLAGDGTAVLYVWSAEENYYWPAPDAAEDVFADASGLDLFQAAHHARSGQDVNTAAWADDQTARCRAGVSGCHERQLAA